MGSAELLDKKRYDLNDLVEIMKILRSPDGCPWDREQTHASIRSCMIEEAYEVVEAIDRNDPVLMREELGDVLFQVVFHARLEEEKEHFDINDVINDICIKMIHRHPHVFGKISVSGTGEVLSNWENIKTEEKQRNTLSSQLRAVPPMLPSLMRASKVCKKAGLNNGQTVQELTQQMTAEIGNLSVGSGDPAVMIGEMLMSVVKLARSLGVDAEEALGQATERVISDIEKQEVKKS